MKKQNLLSVFLLFVSGFSFAQSPLSIAKKDFTYTFVDESGTNGASVTYNPDHNVYYTVMAGNESYAIESFTSAGKNLQSMQVGYDTRGLWYNTKTKHVELNTYSDGGLYGFILDADGGLTDNIVTVAETTDMPDVQSVGAYDSGKNLVLYFSEGIIYTVKASSGKNGKQIELEIPTELENINSTSAIYTGKVGYEYGVLDYVDYKVYLFNRKGKLTSTVKLPEDAITNYSFWFAYANNRVFLYDSGTRTWTGYKIF